MLPTPVHQRLARSFVQPAYHWHLVLRPGTRAVEREYRKGLRFRTQAGAWDTDRRRTWVLNQLRTVVRHAATASPFWAERLRAANFDARRSFSFEDYAALPVLERDQVSAAGESMICTDIARESLVRDSTGGSAGEPTVVWKGPRERAWGLSGIEHFMRRLGVPTGSAVGYLWGHHLDAVHRSTRRDRMMDWMQNVRWFDCFRLSPEILAGYHEELQRWRPSAMVCYASALASLADEVERTVARGAEAPHYPSRAFVTGAEKLHPHQRVRVQQLYGVPALERYGSRDVGLIGFQLPPARWHADIAEYDYEVDWPAVLVEPEAPTLDGRPSSVLVTKLQADGMPMLRYRIGDLARFPFDARPGAPAFTLHEVTGRDVDRIWLSADQWITSLSFPHMLKDYPVREFQVFQRADLTVDVRLVTLPVFTAADQDKVRALVSDLLPGLPVTVTLVDELQRSRAGKLRPVISEVTAAMTSGLP